MDRAHAEINLRFTHTTVCAMSFEGVERRYSFRVMYVPTDFAYVVPDDRGSCVTAVTCVCACASVGASLSHRGKFDFTRRAASKTTLFFFFFFSGSAGRPTVAAIKGDGREITVVPRENGVDDGHGDRSFGEEGVGVTSQKE